jgi:hypothetical protein
MLFIFFLIQKNMTNLLSLENLSQNPHWMQLKGALELAAHTSGLPIMCDGGMDYRSFKYKLRNRVYKPKVGEEGWCTPAR